MQPQKAVVLLSGGIDSSTVLAIAKSEGYELYAMSFDYHQRHSRELSSARMIAAATGTAQHLVIRFDLGEIGGSALTSGIQVPHSSGETLPDCIPVTYVPARNTIFLSFALAWAEVLETGDIFIGANAVDYSGYPDCRREYLEAFESMARLATKALVEKGLMFRVRAPLLSMKKFEIIRKGTELGLDYALTWSCYDPQKSGADDSVLKTGADTRKSGTRHGDLTPCGKCDSCTFRARGFERAGMKDPLLG
jgi:7-cyano-7-deazaguanine synthase